MCKCSFVRGALVALVLMAHARAQEYTVDDPTGDVVFNGVRSTDVSLIFDDSEIVVNPGDQLNLDCGVHGQSRYCIWESESGQILQVEDVYSNVFDGVSKPVNTVGNECGIVINSADIGHHGQWTCKVFVVGKSLVGTKNVIVTIKPTSPILEVDSSRGLVVTNEDETPVKCSVAAARPAVGIRWYLGDRDITVSAETEETPTDKGGIYKSVSTLRRTFQPSENGQLLTCSVTHKTLPVPENTSIALNVVFKPVEKPVSTFYQIRPGNDYEVKLNFSANPAPIRKEWRYGKSFENVEGSISIPGSDGHYRADIEDLGNGMYTAKLLVTGFTEADANKNYLLVVENDYGETQYKVKLSMHEAPKDGDSETSNYDKIPPTELSVSEGIVFDDETKSNTLSGGAVAGIIIVLLIVVAAVGAAGYARYRQMFCFAPLATPDPEEAKDTREEHSDTESARGTSTSHAANLKNRLGQLTQVFKKPKKDHDMKQDETEKKSLTKDEHNKGSPFKEQSPNEKEPPETTKVPEEIVSTNLYSEQNSTYDEHTEDKVFTENFPPVVNNENTMDKKEVVYAELDLGKGEPEKKTEVKAEDKTEYAQIVGTITDNREEEKKE
ncbi:fasciclin-3 isoform X4 [Cherax quadricarinatus]|uniref:fasciclin-3 isoform X4 n=1 Tax=Cherax quadricarinatus TaxID=27406 RepID=UPI00387ECC99